MLSRFIIVLATLLILVISGCTNRMARSLGAAPVTHIGDLSSLKGQDPIRVPLDDQGDGPFISIYLVNGSSAAVSGPSTKDGVYRVADVTEVVRSPYLGVVGSDPPADDLRAQRRQVLAMTLMSIADDNGAEFWRRFSALMTYRKAARDTGKAFMGSSIAATFISPVLGASLAGAGLAFDTFTDTLTSEFDIEMYVALREAVRAEVIRRRTYIREQLKREYGDYPASAVIADVNDYAHIYSIRGAVDALKLATKRANESALRDEQTAREGGTP